MPLPELLPERRAELRRLANQLWRRHGGRIPVALEEIVDQEEELDLVYADLGEALGYIRPDGEDGFLIALNERQPPDSTRNRFTLAHELGHFAILDHAYALLTGKVPAYELRPAGFGEALAELEANSFAAALLMPEDCFLPELHCSPEGFVGIQDVATIFNVSFHAAAIRCVEATDYSCALMVSAPDHSQPPRLTASDAFTREYDVSRQTQIRGDVSPASGCSLIRLGDWFDGLPPALSRLRLVQQTIRRRSGSLFTLLGNPKWGDHSYPRNIRPRRYRKQQPLILTVEDLT